MSFNIRHAFDEEYTGGCDGGLQSGWIALVNIYKVGHNQGKASPSSSLSMTRQTQRQRRRNTTHISTNTPPTSRQMNRQATRKRGEKGLFFPVLRGDVVAVFGVADGSEEVLRGGMGGLVWFRGTKRRRRGGGESGRGGRTRETRDRENVEIRTCIKNRLKKRNKSKSTDEIREKAGGEVNLSDQQTNSSITLPKTPALNATPTTPTQRPKVNEQRMLNSVKTKRTHQSSTKAKMKV